MTKRGPEITRPDTDFGVGHKGSDAKKAEETYRKLKESTKSLISPINKEVAE